MRDRRARPARIAIVAGVALAATPLVGVAPAYACSCVAASEKQHYKNADVVFKGTVAKRVAPPAGQVRSSSYPVTYTFAVTRAYKGKVAERQRVRTPLSSASCGLGLSGKGPFLVFAYEPAGAKKAGANRTLEANLCGGTRPIGAKERPSFGAGRPVGTSSSPAPTPTMTEVTPTRPGPLPRAPSPDVPIDPDSPVAPAERTALDTVNSVLVGGQRFANRLVGPLLEDPAAP